jgi:hydroxypyruvate isomerase
MAWWAYIGDSPNYKEILKGAKEIGYEGVELVPKQHLDLVRDLGLKIAIEFGHQSFDTWFHEGTNDVKEHPRIEKELYANMELANKYQCPDLIIFSGDRQPGLSDEQGIENTAKILAKMAPAAEQAGVNLVLEALNSKVDHEGYQCDKSWWMFEVVKRVNHPRVTALYDIYHMQVMEGDIIRTIQENHALIGHYHTAGNPGRNDMDDTQELNYPPIMRTIKATGYTGYIGQEFVPKGDPIKALKTAYDLCNV